jgi:hypothetical protein
MSSTMIAVFVDVGPRSALEDDGDGRIELLRERFRAREAAGIR